MEEDAGSCGKPDGAPQAAFLAPSFMAPPDFRAWSLLALTAGREAEAGAVPFEDVQVMGQPAEMFACQARGAKHAGSFVERQIAFDQRAGAFAAPAQDLEQPPGAISGERHIPKRCCSEGIA